MDEASSPTVDAKVEELTKNLIEETPESAKRENKFGGNRIRIKKLTGSHSRSQIRLRNQSMDPGEAMGIHIGNDGGNIRQSEN